MRFSSARMYARNAASRFENGSSSRKIAGCTIMLRPSATFCMSLTLRRPARRVERLRQADDLGDALHLGVEVGLAPAAGLRPHPRPKARLSYTLMCVKIA